MFKSNDVEINDEDLHIYEENLIGNEVLGEMNYNKASLLCYGDSQCNLYFLMIVMLMINYIQNH